jgi:hypothetical protein
VKIQDSVEDSMLSLFCLKILEVLRCERGSNSIDPFKLPPLGALQDPGEVKRYLKHMNIDYDPPPRGPPGEKQGSFGFEQLALTKAIFGCSASD